jgi:hypothetical protein
VDHDPPNTHTVPDLEVRDSIRYSNLATERLFGASSFCGSNSERQLEKSSKLNFVELLPTVSSPAL